MLGFVTTVRHPLNSISYERVERLLEATLRSVCRQSDPDFCVVVVHNQLPKVHVADNRVHFVQVGFPAPSEERTSRIDFSAHLRDKGTKYAVGIATAQELGADHIMFFDADDLLHNGLAKWSNEHPGHAGWYSPTGFIHTVGTSHVQFVPLDFHRKNGSTSIVRLDLLGIPNGISRSLTQDDIVRQVGVHTIDEMMGRHGGWQDFLAPQGRFMEPLPFPAAIWEIGTGENHSGNLVSGRAATRIDDQITEDFGLTPPSFVSATRQRLVVTAKRLLRRVRNK